MLSFDGFWQMYTPMEAECLSRRRTLNHPREFPHVPFPHNYILTPYTHRGNVLILKIYARIDIIEITQMSIFIRLFHVA